jgi:hypothetical protein
MHSLEDNMRLPKEAIMKLLMIIFSLLTFQVHADVQLKESFSCISPQITVIGTYQVTGKVTGVLNGELRIHSGTTYRPYILSGDAERDEDFNFHQGNIDLFISQNGSYIDIDHSRFDMKCAWGLQTSTHRGCNDGYRCGIFIQ